MSNHSQNHHPAPQHQNDEVAQKITLPNNRRSLAIVSGIVGAVLAIVIISAPFKVKVERNSAKAQPADPAAGTGSGTPTSPSPDSVYLQPGATHTCVVGETVNCLLGSTIPPVPVDNDNDGDGIANDKDKCPDEAEDVDTLKDEDGCPDNIEDDVKELARLRVIHGQFLRQHGNEIGALNRRVGVLEQNTNLQVNTTTVAATKPKTTIQTTDVFVVNGKQLDNLPPEVRKAIADAATKRN